MSAPSKYLENSKHMKFHVLYRNACWRLDGKKTTLCNYVIHKGQLILKRLFGVFRFFQKTNESNSTCGTQGGLDL